MVTDFFLDLDRLVCEEEGEKRYLLLVFFPARSELSSNLLLFDKPCRQTKYDHFLLYQDYSQIDLSTKETNSFEIEDELERNRPSKRKNKD
jgi:hypothetical protein